ncbi:unnamed protein product [Spirodela intermedia]|uniref:RING-type domain-containing protein n=1 Tax=Spirodela intermedia TaxID=51605 RepID=A0A7I8JI59_SPIIN|nr:unnamed protein product [Spirodela intermedia]CAA6669102.1 unnamed protein product [Spirodela intermedia]
MKFCKKYQEYMQGQEELPRVGLKRLKKILKRCQAELRSGRRPPAAGAVDSGGDEAAEGADLRGSCSMCDGTFFPALLDEMSTITGCFNERARRLLELHLASGVQKYSTCLRRKDLVTYAIINSIAMRKILKKYDKIHYSKQGQEFKSRAQVMHIEILQSPWLCELMAFYINQRECKSKKKTGTELFEDCYLSFDAGKPSLFCGLFDSLKLEIDLTCSICLDTVFDPVSLSCGHIFCHMCSCSAASVSIVDGLKTASSKAKCPLCRQAGVYDGAVHLEELNILLKRSCSEYWEERTQSERAERVRQAKEHWESLCRAFTGI